MIRPYHYRQRMGGGGRSKGAALVITLSMMVLLLFVLMAFFSQTTLQRRVSDISSANAVKDIFAVGALDTVISDLVQEISDGSTITNFVAGTATNTLYLPVSSKTMLPALAGSSGTNGLESLVKRSASGVSFYSGSSYYQDGPARTAAASTTNASMNGRKILPARWNKALMIARANSASPSDCTPTNAFTPPDWVLVTRAGSNPVSWSPTLRWSPSNASTVIGRYAYAIYDEGGCLDANVAGYPTVLSNAASFTASRKSASSFADLSQIGLTATQINALVGWRNYVTASASGSYPGYAFPDLGSNYAASVAWVTNGFLKSYSTNVSGPNPTGAPRTDHLFSSRQQLITFLTGADTSNASAAMNALRYLSAFSRDLNQPSLIPDNTRPRIMSLNSGGNDSVGKDNLINPAFLTTCVTAAFTRNDGAKANVGDPLVRKRFPLNSLVWLTPEGPSATASAATVADLRNAGVPASMISSGTSNNILKYFGLTWNATGTNAGSWTYRAGTNSPIKTLAEVVTVKRDPDFFELLKAALTAGSLGKAYAAPGLSIGTPDGYNQRRDNSLDAQIIQIGANIVDQSDANGYPTRILFNDGSLLGGQTVECRGIEDLPYLYRVREAKVMTLDSTPSVNVLPQLGGSLANPGSGIVFQQPEIWNPHLMVTNAAPRPTNFRLVAATLDPLTQNPVSYVIGLQWMPQTGNNLTWQSNAATTLNAIMTFSIPLDRQDLFREPTLLIKPGIPSGSGLTGPGPYTAAAPALQYITNGITENLQYTGIPMGDVPMAFTATLPAGGISNSVPPVASNGIVPAGFVYYPTPGTAGVSSPCITYRLQCQDATGQWITYDEKFSLAANSTNGYARPGTGTNTNSAVFRFNQNKTFHRDSGGTLARNNIGSEVCMTVFDPRSSRFGMIESGSEGGTDSASSFPLGAALGLYSSTEAPLYSLGWAAPFGSSRGSAAMSNAAAQNAVLTMRPDESAGMLFGSSSGPTANGWYPGNATSRVRPGLFVQNHPNIATTATARFSGDPKTPVAYPRQFFADPDGVVRRGMGAFIPASSAPASPPAAGNPSGIPLSPAHAFDASGLASPIVSGADARESLSRPVILNRPFRSVAELGYVFSGTPWRNLDFSTPESGAAALLDVFCIADTTDSKGMVEGRVNLNTRQMPVLKAILAGAYKDEFNPANTVTGSLVSSSLAGSMASALIARTRSSASSAGPLMNMSELVGHWNSEIAAYGGADLINGGASYVGFSDDSTSASTIDVSSVLASAGVDPEIRIERFREATVRALAAAGQTRVWNLMIDLIVQTGRYPVSAANINQFQVEGELRYWVHLAIDRYSGQVLDKQIEVVQE